MQIYEIRLYYRFIPITYVTFSNKTRRKSRDAFLRNTLGTKSFQRVDKCDKNQLSAQLIDKTYIFSYRKTENREKTVQGFWLWQELGVLSTLNNQKVHWKLNKSFIVLEAGRFQLAGSKSKLRFLEPKIHNIEGNFVWI